MIFDLKEEKMFKDEIKKIEDEKNGITNVGVNLSQKQIEKEFDNLNLDDF